MSKMNTDIVYVVDSPQWQCWAGSCRMSHVHWMPPMTEIVCVCVCVCAASVYVTSINDNYHFRQNNICNLRYKYWFSPEPSCHKPRALVPNPRHSWSGQSSPTWYAKPHPLALGTRLLDSVNAWCHDNGICVHVICIVGPQRMMSLWHMQQ